MRRSDVEGALARLSLDVGLFLEMSRWPAIFDRNHAIEAETSRPQQKVVCAARNQRAVSQFRHRRILTQGVVKIWQYTGGKNCQLLVSVAGAHPPGCELGSKPKF